MKTFLRTALAMSLLLAATGSFAWGNNNWGPFSNNNGWGNDYNPYDEWDPRYWMEEMENAFDDDDYNGPPPGYYGPPPGYNGGPYGGPPPGYTPGPYGPPPGYMPPRPYGPPPGYAPNNAPRPYGPPPGYGPRGPAPQQAPQRAPQQ